MADQNGNAMAAQPPETYGMSSAGTSMYVPLAHSAVTPIGPTSAKSFERRGGNQVVRLYALPADPPAEASKVLLYTRTISGQQVLFCRLPDGTVYQVGAG